MNISEVLEKSENHQKCIQVCCVNGDSKFFQGPDKAGSYVTSPYISNVDLLLFLSYFLTTFFVWFGLVSSYLGPLNTENITWIQNGLIWFRPISCKHVASSWHIAVYWSCKKDDPGSIWEKYKLASHPPLPFSPLFPNLLLICRMQTGCLLLSPFPICCTSFPHLQDADCSLLVLQQGWS